MELFESGILILAFFFQNIYVNYFYVQFDIIVGGTFRESNSRPLAPEARIIPLDQMPL